MVEAPVVKFPDSVIRRTAFWFDQFQTDWRGETPQRIHSRDVADDGSPQWHHEFERWMTTPERVIPKEQLWESDHAIRTTRALRRLRRECVREFEVLYRAMILGENLLDISKWLTERAIRNDKPDRYYPEDVLVLIVAGVDHIRNFW